MNAPAPNSPPPSITRRLARAALLIAASTAVAIALLYGIENFRGGREWTAQRDAMIARGARLAYEDHFPPPIPDDTNFGLLPVFGPMFDYQPGAGFHDTNGFRIAMELLRFVPNSPWKEKEPEFIQWQKGEPTDLAAWQHVFRSPLEPNAERLASSGHARLPNLPPTPQTPARDVLQALSALQPDFDLIERGLRDRPNARYPLRYEDGFACILPHLAKLKGFSTQFGLRAAARLADHQPAAALDDIQTILHLAGTLENEPFLISHLVRLAMLDIALQPVWDGVTGNQFDEPQLAALQTRLAAIDLLPGWRRAMDVERAGTIRFIEDAVGSSLKRAELADMVVSLAPPNPPSPGSLPDDLLPFYFRFAPRGWLYASLAASARSADTLYHAEPSDIPRLLNAPPNPSSSHSLRLLLHRRLFSDAKEGNSLTRSFARTLRGQTHLTLATTAIALARHRLAHQTLPDSLEALTPTLLPIPPIDPINRKAIGYRHEKNGAFTLWSVGEDGLDQQGTPAPRTSEDSPATGDWTWATPAPTPP